VICPTRLASPGCLQRDARLALGRINRRLTIDILTKERKKNHTFFPGLPSTSPTTFSPLPTILSTSFSVLVRGFLALTTPAGRPRDFAVDDVVVVVVVVRGLLVFAVVLLDFFEGARVDSMAWTMRGLELPV